MQFGPCWNIFAKNPNFFRSKYEKQEDFPSSHKNILPQIAVLETQIAISERLQKIFPENWIIF